MMWNILWKLSQWYNSEDLSGTWTAAALWQRCCIFTQWSTFASCWHPYNESGSISYLAKTAVIRHVNALINNTVQGVQRPHQVRPWQHKLENIAGPVSWLFCVLAHFYRATLYNAYCIVNAALAVGWGLVSVCPSVLHTRVLYPNG